MLSYSGRRIRLKESCLYLQRTDWRPSKDRENKNLERLFLLVNHYEIPEMVGYRVWYSRGSFLNVEKLVGEKGLEEE